MFDAAIGFGAIFILGELLALPLFALLRRSFRDIFAPATLFDEPRKSGLRMPGTEMFKGILERFVVTFGLFIALPGILTVFAALKLANRLSHEADDRDITINYFLIGNLMTVLLCLAYYKLAIEFATPLGAWFIALLP